MVRNSTDPLTVAEAKQALRHLVQAGTPRHFISRHPTGLLAFAFLLGLIMENPKPRRIVIGMLEPLLLHYLIPRHHRDNPNTSNKV